MVSALLLTIVLAQIAPSPAPAASAPPAALSVSATSVNLNPAQQQIVTLTGATPPLQVTLDRKLVIVTADPAGTAVTIAATQATGTDVLHVVDATGASADITIRVAFNAGTIVAQTSLTVTGNPARPDWVAREVTQWVRGLTEAMPGAQVAIGSVAAPPGPLEPGATQAFNVPVQINGNGQYFDQSGVTAVIVTNAALPEFLPQLLFYDDDPEHVEQDGVLFRASVSQAAPARLYYYHDDTAEPRSLVVALRSSSDVPASVQLIEANAGPNMDVMQVGNALTQRFMLNKSQGEGVILNLSGDQPYLVTDLPMTARRLVAGTADVRVLSGGPVEVTVLAVSPGVDPRSLLDGPVLAGDGHHRTGVFAITGFGTESLAFAAGGADATTVIGDTDPTPGNTETAALGHDYGDYGVLHTIDLTLANPSAVPAPAYLFMQPLAGPARGSFLIDGNAVEVGCVRLPLRYQIAGFELAPGQTYHSVVQTMTDGGSFYPVRLGVTATPPQPQAPPVNAPDGCFPKPPSPAPSPAPQ